ncbi:hypothetical protein Hanom_Chr15g01391431 [Helianthus anomalus]
MVYVGGGGHVTAFVVGTVKPAQINAHLVKFNAFVVIRTKMTIFRCTGSNSNSFLFFRDRDR